MLSPEQLSDQVRLCELQLAQFRQQGKDATALVAALDMLKGDEAVQKRDLEAAKTSYRASIDGFRKTSMDLERASVALGAAQAFAATGESAAAVEFCDLAVEAVGSLWQRTPLPERVRVPEIVVRTFDTVVKLAHGAGRDDRVFEYLQQAKARWLLDVLMFRQIERVLPVIRKLAGDHAKWEAVAKIAGDRLQEALTGLDARWNAFLGDGASKSGILAAEKVVIERYAPAAQTMFGGARPLAAPHSLAEIQEQLAPEDALLDFFVQSDGVYCAVVKRGFFKVFLQPIPAAELGGIIRSTYVALLQSEDRRVSRKKIESAFPGPIADLLYPDPKPRLEYLYDLLLRPFASELAGTKRWIVCPHWHLHILPFHALRPTAGSAEALVDSAALVYAPSAATWSRLRALDAEAPKDGCAARAVVIGVERTKRPDWYAQIQSFLEKGLGNAQISDFEAEAADIASEIGTTPVVGRSATKAAFFEGIASTGTVHVSCHTLLGRESPLLDGLMLSDGLVTLAEILTTPRLDAARPSLVSLSACRSGLGKIEPGDMFWGAGYGLLMRMGCPILASLWPVDAEATRLLMGEFYREGVARGDWALALQKAQCKVRQSHSRADAAGRTIPFADPYFWAGFFLLGAPQSAPRDASNVK